MPGLVEGHSHVAEGVQWRFVYCGFDAALWLDVNAFIQPGVFLLPASLIHEKPP
jgi:hypothetical protein